MDSFIAVYFWRFAIDFVLVAYLSYSSRNQRRPGSTLLRNQLYVFLGVYEQNLLLLPSIGIVEVNNDKNYAKSSNILHIVQSNCRQQQHMGHVWVWKMDVIEYSSICRAHGVTSEN